MRSVFQVLTLTAMVFLNALLTDTALGEVLLNKITVLLVLALGVELLTEENIIATVLSAFGG
jgi:hypothetical protein